MKVLEVEGCCSSVVRALMAKARGPGFESPATTKIFSHFSFAFFQTPLGEKVSNLLIILLLLVVIIVIVVGE